MYFGKIQEFPKLLASWPFNGATDVPPRPGLEVFLYFEDEVRWSGDGMVSLSNESHIMAAIPTSDYVDSESRNNSGLQVVPELSAVKIRFPPFGPARFPGSGLGRFLERSMKLERREI
eukprot:s5019_g1.t1